MRNQFRVSVLALFACGLMIIASCKRENQNFTVNYQYSYYPLDSGHYVIYNVDSIQYNYNGVQTNDTIVYQEMQIIGDTFYDNQNRVNYYVDNYRRSDSTQSWSFDRRWYAYRSTSPPNLQLVEDDLRFIKLVFPPTANESWNGNIYIPPGNINVPGDQYTVFDNWNYLYENTDTTFNINNLTLNNSIIVSEVNSANLISETIRTEAYAPNVGLIYQQWDALTAGTGSIVTNWDTGNINGFKIRWYIWQHYP
jgi:hypothetical protein